MTVTVAAGNAGAAPSGLDALLSTLTGGAITGGGTNGTGGIADLFAALVGADAGTNPTGAGTQDVQDILSQLENQLGTTSGQPSQALDIQALLQSLQKATGTTTAQLLPLVQQLSLGNGVQLDVQGSGVDVASLQAKLAQLAAQLQKAGIDLDKLGDAKQMAQALVLQGMDPKEADAKAKALETMLAVLKQKLDLKDDETGGVALLLAAGAVQALPLQQAITVTITHADAQVQVVNVGVLKQTLKQVYGQAGGADLSAQLKKGTTADADKTPVVPTFEGPAKDKKPTDTDALLAQQAQQAATQAPADPTAAAVQIDAQAAAPAVVSATNKASGVTEIGDKDVLKPVDAAVMYKMKEDKDGALTVEATPAAHKVLEQQFDAQNQNAQAQAVVVRQPGSLDKNNGQGVQVQSAWPFANQVALAAKNDTTGQTVVQMQKLVGEGGGTVRIQLHPADLGQVNVELTIKDGQVTGTVSASDVAVVHELAKDIHHLHDALANAGLKLGQDGLNVALNQQGQQGFGQNQQAHGQRDGTQFAQGRGEGSAQGGVASGEEIVTIPGRWVAPDSLVDMDV